MDRLSWNQHSIFWLDSREKLLVRFMILFFRILSPFFNPLLLSIFSVNFSKNFEIFLKWRFGAIPLMLSLLPWRTNLNQDAYNSFGRGWPFTSACRRGEKYTGFYWTMGGWGIHLGCNEHENWVLNLKSFVLDNLGEKLKNCYTKRQQKLFYKSGSKLYPS